MACSYLLRDVPCVLGLRAQKVDKLTNLGAIGALTGRPMTGSAAEAIQFLCLPLDCFVAELLAMTTSEASLAIARRGRSRG